MTASLIVIGLMIKFSMIVEVENEDPLASSQANANNQVNVKSALVSNDDKYYAIPSLLPSSHGSAGPLFEE
eukprot:gene18471-26055_t